MPESLCIGCRDLGLRDLEGAARHHLPVTLAPEARPRLEAARAVIERAMAEGRVIYGATTGFGRLCEVVLPVDQSEILQRNLILSHAAGVGPPFPVDVVRGMLLLRANALALGHSGVRPAVVEALLDLLNRGVHPLVPQQGSLGASGDLAPLAHLTLVLIGEGWALSPEGRPVSGREALQAAGLEPLALGAKEGLALINGTQAMTATLGLALVDAFGLVEAATVAAALTLEALQGVRDAFDPRLGAVRSHPGQNEVAARIRDLTAGSRYLTGAGELRVQDAYSLRCVPQVHGASADALDWAAGVVEREMNAATDNPLVFPAAGAEADAVLSGGNFHGQPVAFAGDLTAIATAELGAVSERRTARLIDPNYSFGLPAFLIQRSGLHSGFMIAQYTAAALVSENKTLASPASVDSIPSSAGQEDHVSMGTIAARQAAAVVANTAQVIAIELLAAAQAIDLRGEAAGVGAAGGDARRLAGPLGEGTRRAYLELRQAVPFLSEDRILAVDIDRVTWMIRDGVFRW